MVIGCVEWVNPITHPTGLTLFGGLSVGQFVRYPCTCMCIQGLLLKNENSFVSINSLVRINQLVIPLLNKLRANSQYKLAITNATIAEIRAPFRKLMTKVPLLVAITKPMIGHKQSEHMK